MSLKLTELARNESQQIVVEPQLVLTIDGVNQKYGLVKILSYIKVGDPDLYIGDDWVVGGLRGIQDQSTLITLGGTTTTISQQLNPDRNVISSIQSMQIALIDKNNEITKLVTPGEVVTDILGRKAKVYLGFKNTAFPQDYTIIFRGNIDDVQSDPGKIILNIAHPDQKKRQALFNKLTTEVSSHVNSVQTHIDVTSTAGFLTPVLGPDGLNDPSFKYYVQIEDEVIRYTGLTSTMFTGCTRAQLGTTNSTHAVGKEVNSVYGLEATAMDAALKLMMSGQNGNYISGLAPKSFRQLTPTEFVDNAIYFNEVDVKAEYGVTVGDYVTTTGAANGANNVTLKQIISIVNYEIGSYIVVDGVTFVTEDDTAATISFRSKYDSLGYGLAMSPDEVDVEEHEKIKRLFLSSFNYDFRFTDVVEDLKQFIEQQIYQPAACYSLPRKARSSVGYHIGPIPGSDISILSKANVTTAEKLRLRRTIAKNFYNTIIYRYDSNVLEPDKYLRGFVVQDAGSKTQIPVGNKAKTISSLGMRKDLSADVLAQTAATRMLNRYKFGAEFIDGLELFYGDGFKIEVGDIVLLNGEGLQLTDITNGSREFEPRLFEVTNKSLDIKTGQVKLSLTDTNFSAANRYGVVSASSIIKSGSSQTQFVIESDGLFSQYGAANEYLKWNKYAQPVARVRSADFSVVSPTVEIVGISGNSFTVGTALGFTPLAGYILELGLYNTVTDEMKLVYASMRDNDPFDDTKPRYRML